MIIHNLLHFKEDTCNFSGQDNYSCWNKERAVRRYVRQSNNRKNIECTFAATEERREALKFRKESENLGPDPAKTDPNKRWAKSIEQAKKLYYNNSQVHSLAKKSGMIVGGSKPFIMNDVVRQAISNGTCCRSAWFPIHGYDGLLYRQIEHAIVIREVGETTVKLLNFFCAFVCDKWELFFKAKEFQDVGCSDTGWKVVEEGDNTIVAPLQNISRKVMLFVNDTGRPTYVVIYFMRRIFPVSAGTVVVPYYPVKNDMILVQGDDEDSGISFIDTASVYNIP